MSANELQEFVRRSVEKQLDIAKFVLARLNCDKVYVYDGDRKFAVVEHRTVDNYRYSENGDGEIAVLSYAAAALSITTYIQYMRMEHVVEGNSVFIKRN